MSHKLTAKQVKSIHFLVRGDTTAAISRAMKLRRETLSRWKKIPEFMQEYERLIAEAKARLQTSIEDILETSMIALKKEINRYESDPKRIQTLPNVVKALEK